MKHPPGREDFLNPLTQTGILFLMPLLPSNYAPYFSNALRITSSQLNSIFIVWSSLSLIGYRTFSRIHTFFALLLFFLYKQQAHGRPLIAIYRRLVLSSCFYLLLLFVGQNRASKKPPTYNPQDFPLLAVFQQIKHLKDNSSRQNHLVIVVFLG